MIHPLRSYSKQKNNNKREANNAFETNYPSSIKKHERWSKLDEQKSYI